MNRVLLARKISVTEDFVAAEFRDVSCGLLRYNWLFLGLGFNLRFGLWNGRDLWDWVLFGYWAFLRPRVVVTAVISKILLPFSI